MANTYGTPRVLLGTAACALLLAAPTRAGTFNANFNDAQVPLNTGIFGNAVVEATGGTGDSGCLKLTKAVNSQSSSFIINDLDNFSTVYGFRLTFQARIGGGTAVPADGWSVCVSPDLADAPFGETGTGSGLRVGFDTYDNTDGDPNNGAGEAPRINIYVNNAVVASTPLLPLSDLINNAFVPVEINVDGDGSLDVIVNGKAHFSNYFLPGYVGMVAPRFGIGARTGGLNCNHFVDDLSLTTTLTALPGIVQQPQSVRVLEGSSATFSVVANNADMATIQWLRDGVAIPGANALEHTVSGATLADDGAKFSVRLTLGAQTVTSAEATLNVVQIELPASPVVSYDFNGGSLPPEALVYGAGIASDGFSPWLPFVSPTGGVGDSGVLLITEALNDQSGAFLVPDPHAGAPVYGVAARFDVRIGGGSDVPADGMSFNFAADLPDATAGGAEEGVGSGLRVCFDIYDNADGNPNNATGEAPAITLKWGNTVVGESRVALSDITTGDGFADVIVRLTADGLLDVAWNGKVLMYRAPVPGFGSVSAGRFGFYARTGGLNANQWVDNLRIYTYLTAPLRISKQPASQLVLVGKSATFDVEVTTPEGATYQWYRNGTAIGGATSASYNIATTTAGDDGAVFKVDVTLGGTTLTSTEATLSVLDLAPPASPTLNYHFNAGLPVGAEIGGNAAFVDSVGGVGDSGVLKLTSSANDQNGGFRSAAVEGGAQLLDFTLAADVLAGNGTTPPADGFSINIGSDVPVTAPGEAENGAGNGITIAFDTFDNGGGEGPSIDVRYKTQIVAATIVPQQLVNSGAYAQVLVRVKENGMLDLAMGDTVVYRNLQIPDYAPMSGVKVAIYARTGGLNASYWFDNVQMGVRIPATISITVEPQDALVLAGQPATFSVGVSNPQGVTYQWRRNGTAIAGATGATYTTPALSAADEGAAYSVVVTGPGNAVTSRDAIVAVMTPFDTAANPAVNVDFNDGAVPVDGLVVGTAFVQSFGGVGDTPYVSLTEAINSQGGVFLLNTPAGVDPIHDFTATWMMLVGGGTDTPADGCSFVLGADVPDAVFGEDGAGSDLIVSFDTFDNGTTEVAPEIEIRYKTQSVATRAFDISVLRTGTVFEKIGVRVNRSGTLDLYYGDTAVYRGLVLPNYTPFAAGRFGWGARTGGLNDNHWIDDVKISFNQQSALPPAITYSVTGGNLTLTWPGGGALESTAALPGGWSTVTGATSGYTTPIGTGSMYFRVRQP